MLTAPRELPSDFEELSETREFQVYCSVFQDLVLPTDPSLPQALWFNLYFILSVVQNSQLPSQQVKKHWATKLHQAMLETTDLTAPIYTIIIDYLFGDQNQDDIDYADHLMPTSHETSLLIINLRMLLQAQAKLREKNKNLTSELDKALFVPNIETYNEKQPVLSLALSSNNNLTTAIQRHFKQLGFFSQLTEAFNGSPRLTVNTDIKDNTSLESHLLTVIKEQNEIKKMK